MRGFRFRSTLYIERCAHICLASSRNLNVWRPNIHVWIHFEPIFSLRVHDWIQTTLSQLAGVCVDVAVDVIVFVQCFHSDVAKTSISNFRRVGTAFSDEFPQAWTVLLFGSYSGQIFPRKNLLDSSAKVIPSLHVISLVVRDRQWNELPAKFKITWRHSNRPIRWRP